jgi:hypothetical protein
MHTCKSARQVRVGRVEQALHRILLRRRPRVCGHVVVEQILQHVRPVLDEVTLVTQVLVGVDQACGSNVGTEIGHGSGELP